MTATASSQLRQLDRASIQPFLPLLSDWLLPGAGYGVQHTWPQLYRSDGDGRFFALFDGPRLLSHCALRSAALRTQAGTLRIGLIGSVATDPAERGKGFASRVLGAAIAALRAEHAAGALLWAEQPGLYQRHGFAAGGDEECLLLRPSAAAHPGVRPATIADHAALCALHAAKPSGIERDLRAMSGLLTTPGLHTFVLEQNGRVVAYACMGKGADLQGHWHELGGSDADVATLLPAATAHLQRAEAFVLTPPYRRSLAELLTPCTVAHATVAGPMVLSLDPRLQPPVWIDGLDSV